MVGTTILLSIDAKTLLMCETDSMYLLQALGELLSFPALTPLRLASKINLAIEHARIGGTRANLCVSVVSIAYDMRPGKQIRPSFSSSRSGTVRRLTGIGSTLCKMR